MSAGRTKKIDDLAKNVETLRAARAVSQARNAQPLILFNAHLSHSQTYHKTPSKPTAYAA